MIEVKPGAAKELPPRLRQIGQRLTVGSGHVVFRMGDPVRGAFAVQAGEIRLLRYGSDGREVVLQRAMPGDCFAEAALWSARYRCHAIATTAAELLLFSKESMHALFANEPLFARDWIALLSRQLHGARARQERLSLKTAAERVMHYLQTEGRGTNSEVALAGSTKDLAKELGITHEALYRTLSRLEANGVIVRSGGRIAVR